MDTLFYLSLTLNVIFLLWLYFFLRKKTPNKEINITEEKSQEQTKHTDTGAA